jgi:protein-S-isoprenylcysteine O-methyltransferase Ste14
MVNWVLVSLAGFAILHSGLASMRLKANIRRRIGERAYLGLYRIIFNTVSVIAFVPVMLLVGLTPGPVIWHMSGRAAVVVVQIVCALGLVYAGSQIDLGRLAGVRQLRAYIRGEALPLPPEPFVRHGMYGLVRHPLYACLIVSLWAVPTMRAAHLVFALGTTVYFVVGGTLEEHRLIAEMGETYIHYRAQVPFLIPFVHIPPASCCMANRLGSSR